MEQCLMCRAPVDPDYLVRMVDDEGGNLCEPCAEGTWECVGCGNSYPDSEEPATYDKEYGGQCVCEECFEDVEEYRQEQQDAYDQANFAPIEDTHFNNR